MAEAVYNYARWWGIKGLIVVLALLFSSCSIEVRIIHEYQEKEPIDMSEFLYPGFIPDSVTVINDTIMFNQLTDTIKSQ